MAKRQRMRETLLLIGAMSLAGTPSVVLGQPWKKLVLPPVEVIGVTPVHGIGLPEGKFPGNVQSASGDAIRNSHNVGLGEYINRHLGSVFINESQDNPLQPNLSYRGYTTSPLLGLPQGLAVYQDGVRVNEPFGATVNFSLIPQSAIASIELIPGANPVFGRNALGGALSIRTKSGFSEPGTGGEAYYGSFDRKYFQGQTGGHVGRIGYFVTGQYFDEAGWRDFSPSRDKQVFAKLSWRDAATALDLSVTAADTDLIGNGTLPVQLLAIDRRAIFTRPDATKSALAMFNLRGNHQLNKNIRVGGNLYFRRNDIDTRNGDDSDFAPCEEPAHQGLLCSGVEEGDEEVEGDEEIVRDGQGSPIKSTAAVLGGTNNASATDQDGYGGNLQLTFSQDLFDRQNQLIVGAALNGAAIGFHSQTELASLDFTRLAVGSGILDRSSFVSAGIHNLAYGVYFTDTWSPTSALAVTLSGRYNHASVYIHDRIGAALTGDHTYSHFNPALGVTYRIIPALGIYARYSVSNRTPEAVELTCANPDAPCRLPNDFVSDPNLEQVVARSEEVGVRGYWSGIKGTLAVFHTVNHDDIEFISAGKLMNTGFFKNVGDTWRQGVELTLTGRAVERLTWFLDYTYLQAEFRSPFTARSPNHPLADALGDIRVESGERIPGVPHHVFKAGGDFAVTPALSLGATVLYNSDRFLRGDDSNQLAPVSGYTLVNMRGNYRISDRVSVFARVTNLFDEDYASFGTLGDAGDVLGERFDNPRFLSPGAPRAGFFGVRVSF